MLFVDVGWLGSPVDFGTFVMVLVMFVYRMKPRVETLSASVVALAEQRDDVDDDRLREELDVDDRQVEALRPRIVRVCDEDDGRAD
jgi:hypothetical protein